jgi:tRNA nucleotidyltransferase/poly(A) polymerase
MCQPKSAGGRRCVQAATVNARRTVAQRLKRHTEAGRTDLAEADREVLAGLDAARAHYGNVVTPMELDLPETVHEAFTVIRDAGFRPMVVGGSVRDALTDGRSPKDIDVEVYGATIDETLDVLRVHYRVDEVGKSFGVLKVLLADGTDLDVSVPRRDNHTGAGHRGFTVDTDISMTAEEAAARRDFTINAMGYDPEFGVCVDPYHGRDDLNDGVLRATSEAFAEDPLRVLRGFQFAARYNMAPDDDTAQVCRDLVDRSNELPVERVRGEWSKFYTKGHYPAHGLRVLNQIGWDTTVPGLVARNTDALQVRVENAAALADADRLDGPARQRLVAATIARGMRDEEARAFIDHTIEGGDEQRAAYGLSRTAYPSIGTSDHLTRAFAHACSKNNTSIREWARLASVTGDPMLPETMPGDPDHAADVLAEAERLGCADAPQPDLVLGRDIIARFVGRRPGPWTGEVQRAARLAQIEGVITTREEADAWLQAHPDPA